MVKYEPAPLKLEKFKGGPLTTRTLKPYVLDMASKTNDTFDNASLRPRCEDES